MEDLEEEASAAAMGSPQAVSACVGKPPSLRTTGVKASGGSDVTLPETLAGPRGLAKIDVELIAAGLPVDRFSLCVDDEAPERLLFLWRPFCCPDLGTGASESGPVDRSLRIDEAVVRALVARLVVLRVSHAGWFCPGSGDRAPADTSSLVEEVGVQAALRVFADWRCQGAGGWALAGASLTDVAAERTLAAPRAFPSLTDGADAWAPTGTGSSSHSVGATLDRALTLLAVGGAPHVGCGRLAAAVPRILLLPFFFLLPVPFEPVADQEEPLGRLTLGGVLSSTSHSGSGCSPQSSGPATLPDGGGRGEGGDDDSSEPEPMRGEFGHVSCSIAPSNNART